MKHAHDWIAERLSHLQGISTELARASSISDVADVVMTVLATPMTTPTRGLWLHRSEEAVLELAAETGMPPASVAQFARVPTTADLPVAVAHRERRTVRSASRADSEATFEGLVGAYRLTQGFVVVPLMMEGRSLGAFSLGFDEVPAPTDILFLEAVASQVAQTLVRLRLAERDRRRGAELEFLADLTDAALSAADPVELLARVTAAAVPMLGDWCSVYFLPEDDITPLVSVAHVDPERVAWAHELQERFPFDPESDTGVAAVIRSGTTEFIPKVDAQVIDDAIERSGIDDADARAVVEDLALTSLIIVPLLTKRRVVGAMQFVSAESGRYYDELDVALAETAAGRLAEALDNAWTADRQRHIAITLQRALLPPRLPQIPGVDIAARYLPAGVSEVGGDFYDVFAIDDDTWAILIGDVCGSGPNAAAVSSIARHTVRAAARHGLDHATVIAWVNEAIVRSDRDLFCTACYATLTRRAGSWVLRSVAAGHPLPILTRRGGAATLGRPGTLLGVFDEVAVTPAETALDPGDLVVFYTDGVTDLPPPFGLTADELTDLAADLSRAGDAQSMADGIHQSIETRLPDRRRQDDVAMVVIAIA